MVSFRGIVYTVEILEINKCWSNSEGATKLALRRWRIWIQKLRYIPVIFTRFDICLHFLDFASIMLTRNYNAW